MLVGLLIGKATSVGIPGKNTREIVGRPMAEYGFIAARGVGVDRLFTSTDSDIIAEIGQRYGAVHIPRPPELAQPDSLTEDALTHAYAVMSEQLGQKPEIVLLLFANNPAIDLELVREGIASLQADVTLDSAFSVCEYNMFSPTRARRLDEAGFIQPFVPLEVLGENLSSIRDSQGSVYFCDLSVQVIRGRCFENMAAGMQPFQWMGQRSKALHNAYGFDVDSIWQFVVIEHWLREHGFTETTIPYDLGDPATWR